MGRKLSLFLAVGLLVSVRTLDGVEPLRMQVSPAVSRAPAVLTVKVTIEASADNRFLQVVAESPDFYTSSQVPIDGRNTPPLNVVEFRNLPTGLYQVTSVLVGTRGPRGTASGLAQVIAPIGSVR